MKQISLSKDLRAALERVPDEWTFRPLIDFGPGAPRLIELRRAGLVERKTGPSGGIYIRRTPAGRAALEVKP